jgi:hypothetical protein
VAIVSLSFLNRRAVNKQVCRVCHEFTELTAERLCAACTSIKVRLRSDLGDGAQRANSAEYQCTRAGCLCNACGGRTLDAHPVCSLGPARRELHFHPRCHELWVELGAGARPSATLTPNQP